MKSIIDKHTQEFEEYLAQQEQNIPCTLQEANSQNTESFSQNTESFSQNTESLVQISPANQIDMNRTFVNSEEEDNYLEKNPHEYALYYLPEIKEAIKKIGAKVVKMDLQCEGEAGFMNETNLPKFLTKNTPEPIFVGYNKEENFPVMIVRYIDEINNKTLGIENATSFVFIMIMYIPHVGLEPMTMEYGPTKIDGKIRMMQTNSSMNLDGGQAIDKYVVNLIEGKLPGKRIR